MAIAIVIAIVALGCALGTLKRRYNFGSRQEVLRLFGVQPPDSNDPSSGDIRRPRKHTPFRGFRLAG